MPILVDLSQCALSNILMSPNIKKTGEIDSDLVKHMIFNSIRSYSMKFKNKYGNMVICCDSKHYWRKDIFPHYKAGRRENRDQSSLDWGSIYSAIDSVKLALKEHFPYKVVEVKGAEADDIIGVLASLTKEPTVIIGSDKDYVQLLKFDNVKQYHTKTKRFVKVDCPVEQLRELIITGDKSDGIPNIKSDSDTFVTDKRQSNIYKKDLAKWVKLDNPKDFCESKAMLDNYRRNEGLISFDKIPDNVRSDILEEYNKPQSGSKMEMMNYFMKNRMRNLYQCADEF